MTWHELVQRPSAPKEQPVEQILHDDQIITHRNHPVSKFKYFDCFTPSFVGKTWKEMKQREENRNTNFFLSNDLEEELKILYDSLSLEHCTPSYKSYTTCLEFWRNHPTSTLDLSYATDLTNISCLPPEVKSVIFDDDFTPTGLSENQTLRALKIQSNTLPVMSHLQVLEWTPVGNAVCDFSQWTSLRVFIIQNHTIISNGPSIRLPSGLISFTFHNYCDNDNDKYLSYENLFEDVKYNTSVLQSLKHLDIRDVNWPILPILTDCMYLCLHLCKQLKNIEAPKCRVLFIRDCEIFAGFGPITMTSNFYLEKVVFNIHRSFLKSKIPFQFPPGSPSGYKNIDLFRFPISTLPDHYDPFAYISIFDCGPHLYINDTQTRENLVFYFDHNMISYISQDAATDEFLPKEKETLRAMVDRVYGFNWPKFMIKIQRQYRFNKFMKQEHKELISFLPDDISKYNIGKLLGATQTFKPFNKAKEEQQQQTPSSSSFIPYISGTVSKRKRIS